MPDLPTTQDTRQAMVLEGGVWGGVVAGRGGGGLRGGGEIQFPLKSEIRELAPWLSAGVDDVPHGYE